MLKMFSLEKINSFIAKYKWLPLLFLAFVFLALLFLRYPTNDEALYLQETYLMSELIKSGKWFGDYGVGLHGFIFKLPVALLFIITGPSALVATLFNYILAVLSLYLVYKIAKYYFKSDILIWTTVILTAFSFEFVRSTPTYLRELPSLFSVLLFAYLYLKDSKKWLLGISMLLILDSKEYMFFIVGFSYVLIELLNLVKSGINLKNIWMKFLDYLQVFLPSFIFIALMLSTSIIPINMFLASVLGLIDKGLTWSSAQFSKDLGTSNVVNSGDIKVIFQIVYNSGNSIINFFINIFNTLLSYVGKLLYPRSFSYTSIPRIILIPVMMTGVYYFRDWFKRDNKLNFLFINIFVFFVVFLLRSAQGRYLFSITPFVFILITLFLTDINKDRKFTNLVITLTWVIEVCGLYFETSQPLIRMIMSLIILISYLFVLYFGQKQSKYKEVFIYFSAIVISGITSLSSLYFLYSQGQLKGSLSYGYEFESTKISKVLEKYPLVYVNAKQTENILATYMKETYLSPTWKLSLNKSLPKTAKLKTYGDLKIKYVTTIPIEELTENKDSVLALFDSKKLNDDFINEKTIPSLLIDTRFKLLEKINLKGKVMYIFDYIGK